MDISHPTDHPCPNDIPNLEEDTPEYLAWVKAEEARGELAFQPETLSCYHPGCTYSVGAVVKFDSSGFKYVERKVVALGEIVEPRRDPTQSYRLECGHTVI